MSFIEFDKVYRRYQTGEVSIPAVDGVSFQIEKGEFCLIVGTSGAGKSTVLNILGGMDICDDGTYTMCGDNQTELEKGIEKDQIIAYVAGLYRKDKLVDINSGAYKAYKYAKRQKGKLLVNLWQM